MSWTEEKVAKLKELWGKGNTASQIAEIIGGISRNAVIGCLAPLIFQRGTGLSGKAHRLNLSAKIKTRAATSNQNFESSIKDKNVNMERDFINNTFKIIANRDIQKDEELLHTYKSLQWRECFTEIKNILNQ